jgi:hypothetical protein
VGKEEAMQFWDGALWLTISTWVQTSVSMAVLRALGSWYVARRLKRYEASLSKDIEGFKKDAQEQLARLNGEVRGAAEKAFYMHKMQLDAERDIYKELWPKLRAVWVALQQITSDKAAAELMPQDWRDRRHQFETAVRALAEVAEDQRPFFAARIAGDLFALFELAYQGLEMTEIERSTEMQSLGPKRKTVSPVVSRNLFAIEHAANQLCESIRERLTGTENAIQ